MSDQPTTPGEPATGSTATSVTSTVSASASSAAAQVSARVEERPELAVGGAFAGGLILALVLKRLVR